MSRRSGSGGRVTVGRSKYRGVTSGGGEGANVIDTPPGGSGETVVVHMWTFSGVSDTRWTFGSVPCKPGVIFAGTINKVKLYDEGFSEMSIARTALEETWPDGSLCAVGVGLMSPHTSGSFRAVTANVGGAATAVAELSWVEPIYTSASLTTPAAQHKAVLAVMDSAYLIATDIAHTPLMREEDEPNVTTADQTIKVTLDPALTSAPGSLGRLGHYVQYTRENGGITGVGPITTYEHPWALFCGYVRATDLATKRTYYELFYQQALNHSGETEEYRIGSTLLQNTTMYRGVDSSLPVAGDSAQTSIPAEQHQQTWMSLLIEYVGTGYRQPWRRLSMMLSYSMTSGSCTTYATLRDRFFANTTAHSVRFNMNYCGALIAGYLGNATLQVGTDGTGYGSGRDNTTESFADQVPWMLDALESTVYTAYARVPAMNGLVGQLQTVTDLGPVGEFPSHALFNITRLFSVYYRRITADARIPARFEIIADFLIGQMVYNLTMDQYALPYTPHTPPCADADLSSNDNYFYPQIVGAVFGFLYARETDPTKKAKWELWLRRSFRWSQVADSPAGGGQQPNTKRIGEYNAGDQQSAIAYLHGTAIHNVPGALPTSIIAKPTRPA